MRFSWRFPPCLLLLAACPPPAARDSSAWESPPPDTRVVDETSRETGTDTHTGQDRHTGGSGRETGHTGEPDTTDHSFVATAVVDPEVSLVVRVTWTTDVPGTSWVTFGEDPEALDRTTPALADTSTDHEVFLYGLRPETEIHWRATTRIGRTDWSYEGATTTGRQHPDYPAVTLVTWDPTRTSSERYFIGARTAERGQVLAMDREGVGVWYLPQDPSLPSSTNPSESLTATLDPAQVLVGAYSYDRTLWDSYLVLTTMDGDLVDLYDVGEAHHMAIVLPDGTMAWIAYDRRDYTDPATGLTWPVIGDRIVEQDPSGLQREVFSTWDWRSPDTSGWGDRVETRDWTHANTLFYDPDTDFYILSLAEVSTVLEIHRTTGLVVRSCGEYGEYTAAVGTTRFHFQHDARWTSPDTILMTSQTTDEKELYAVELELDAATRTYRRTWSWGERKGYGATCGGQARRLANGNTFFNTGSVGTLLEITPEGDVVWELQTVIPVEAFFKLWPIEDFYSGF